MWLLDKLDQIKKEESLLYGGSEGEYGTVGECAVSDMPFVYPYGFGENCENKRELVFLRGERDICLGSSEKLPLERGEVRIYNDAGAKISLRADGSVSINDGFIIDRDGKIHVKERA